MNHLQAQPLPQWPGFYVPAACPLLAHFV